MTSPPSASFIQKDDPIKIQDLYLGFGGFEGLRVNFQVGRHCGCFGFNSRATPIKSVTEPSRE
jgi:hypothetical protein